MSTRSESNKQEKRIALSLSEMGERAKQQMASGAIWFAKSDVVSEKFQIEAKTRIKPCKSITVKKEWLVKIANEALMADKMPVLAISFGDGLDYFVLGEKEFYYMVKSLGTLDEYSTRIADLEKELYKAKNDLEFYKEKSGEVE